MGSILFSERSAPTKQTLHRLQNQVSCYGGAQEATACHYCRPAPIDQHLRTSTAQQPLRTIGP